MPEEPNVLDTPRGSIFPKKPSPGALGVVAPQDRFQELEELQRENVAREWEVRGVVSDHIPLSGLGAFTRIPQHRLFLDESPLTIWLHRGGDRAVFFDLVGNNPEKKLDYIAVRVRTRLPSEALLLAREPLNRLLDVLVRTLEMPLVFQRLDLMSPRDGQILAQELVLPPKPSGVRLGPLGGYHQSDLFAAYDAIQREALTNPSPFYQLLCAFRLYAGAEWIRKSLRQQTQRLGIEATLPKDPRIDAGELEAMGMPAELADGVSRANELFSKMTHMRNAIAHFLVKGEEGESHMYLADGASFQAYSTMATILLRYAQQALDDLRRFYSEHLAERHMIGSVLPMVEHRDRFIVRDPREG
jgi:hypothetical protein